MPIFIHMHDENETRLNITLIQAYRILGTYRIVLSVNGRHWFLRYKNSEDMTKDLARLDKWIFKG